MLIVQHYGHTGDWRHLNDVRQLLLLRVLRPDRLTHALTGYCALVMGPAYTSQVVDLFHQCRTALSSGTLPIQDPFTMTALLRQTSSTNPVLFVPFPGYSPTKDIEACAATQVLPVVLVVLWHHLPQGKTVEAGTLKLLSMGQGQEGPAAAALQAAAQQGGWVVLDNVHLMQGWLPTLERLLESCAANAHPDFRCFLSAEPIAGAPLATILPEGLLQSVLTIANEPPSDLRSNMRRALACFSQVHSAWLLTTSRVELFQRLASFHHFSPFHIVHQPTGAPRPTEHGLIAQCPQGPAGGPVLLPLPRHRSQALWHGHRQRQWQRPGLVPPLQVC